MSKGIWITKTSIPLKAWNTSCLEEIVVKYGHLFWVYKGKGRKRNMNIIRNKTTIKKIGKFFKS